MIYFIQSIEGGPIKVGFTNGNPADRLRTLQTASAEKLKLLHVREGTVGQEQGIHADLADHRLNGEWFEPVPAVFEWMTKALPKPPKRQRQYGVVQPNPEALLRSPGEDEALHMAFAQEIARQVVISYRNEGMTIKEAIRIPAEKWGLKTFLKGLWQGRRPHIKTHLVMRLFTEWLNRYHPDLEPYAQQILTAFYDNRTFQNGPMRTDVAARRWSLKHRAAMREYFMLDGLTAAQADRRMIFV